MENGKQHLEEGAAAAWWNVVHVRFSTEKVSTNASALQGVLCTSETFPVMTESRYIRQQHDLVGKRLELPLLPEAYSTSHKLMNSAHL